MEEYRFSEKEVRMMKSFWIQLFRFVVLGLHFMKLAGKHH